MRRIAFSLRYLIATVFGFEGILVAAGFTGLSLVAYTIDPRIAGLIFFGGLLLAGISVAVTPKA